jgi:Pentapeptide repeats (8 copies)
VRKRETAEMAEEPRKDEQGVRQDHRLPHKAWVSLTTAVVRPLAVVLAVIAIVFVLLLVVGLIWGFSWYLSPIFGSKEGLDITQRKDLVQGLASVVQALAVVLTGTVGLIGLLFTWRNLRQTRESTQRTLELTEQGQITERFTRAIDQLGDTDANENPRLEIRLGGIYALERIDKESPKRAYHSTVMEVLTAYIRENAPWPPKSSKSSEEDFIKPPEEAPVSDAESDTAAEHERGTELGTEPAQRTPSTDIQAILDVLKRREEDHVLDKHRVRLDLQGTDLRGANLNETHLERANLQGAHLEGANLIGAHLGGADLREAHLDSAKLQEAQLDDAKLEEAFLEGAALYGAHLKRASLTGAHLEGANLIGAHLEGADLREAHLERAKLQGAHLERALLYGARLKEAKFLKPGQIQCTYGNETTELPGDLGGHRPSLWSQNPAKQMQIIQELLKQEPKDE